MKKKMRFSGYIIAALLAVVFLTTPAIAGSKGHKKMDHKNMDCEKMMKKHKNMDHNKMDCDKMMKKHKKMDHDKMKGHKDMDHK